MCRNSRSGAKSIVALCFVFVLLVSPCFARASWAGLFAPKSPTVLSAEEPKASVEVSQEESSQELLETLSQTAEIHNFDELTNKLSALKTAYTESQIEIEVLSSSLTNLKTQLETLSETNAIGDAQYKEALALIDTLSKEVDEKTETVAKSEKEIAKLMRKAGAQGFGKVNTLVGFNNGIPEWSAGIGLGLKFKSGLVAELGANYVIGNLNKPFNDIAWDVDRLTVSASFGWLF